MIKCRTQRGADRVEDLESLSLRTCVTRRKAAGSAIGCFRLGFRRSTAMPASRNDEKVAEE